MGIIFISYRRADDATMTGRISDRLVGAFGGKTVYRDTHSIEPGEEFPKHIEAALHRADVEVVVIGPKWADMVDQRGNRRLDDPADLVRHEIEVALTRRIGIVPVLIDGASMPEVNELPESIQALHDHNAISVGSESSFDDTMRRLIAAVKKKRSEQARRRRIAWLTRSAIAMAWATCVIAGIALLALAAILSGLASWPPLVATLVHRYPAVSLLTSGLLLAAGLSSLTILRSRRAVQISEDGDQETVPDGWSGPRVITSLATSSLSAVFFVALLTLELFQSSGCQVTVTGGLVCGAPSHPTRGVTDGNLDMYLIAIESGAYVISGDPRTYTLANAPSQQTAAVRMDEAGQGPYKIAVGVHNLQQGRFGLIIEEVDVKIDAVPSSPYPLNVWTPGAPLDYRTNPYAVTYKGEAPGALLPARYVTVPDGKVQLAPGESDQLDVQLTSQVRADVRFQIAVVYKSVVDPTRHTLVLPQTFEVVFSDASNWHPYAPQGAGTFAPTR